MCAHIRTILWPYIAATILATVKPLPAPILTHSRSYKLPETQQLQQNSKMYKNIPKAILAPIINLNHCHFSFSLSWENCYEIVSF